jgi:hypothetical protein
MALDQGIIFEGGARIAQGQLPFRDFYLPFGIIPCYIQAALFKIFGISWKVYALHACIINGFTAIIIYRLFQILTPYSLGFRLFITIFSTCFFIQYLPRLMPTIMQCSSACWQFIVGS